MTRIEEERTTTMTHEEVEPVRPRVENVNVNTKGDTISINHPDPTPDETTHTETTTTHSEVHRER
jgi:hypothetical protein